MVVPSGPGDRNGLHKDNLLMSISIYLIIYLHFLMIVSRGDQNGLRKDTHLFVFFFYLYFGLLMLGKMFVLHNYRFVPIMASQCASAIQ